MKNVVMYLFDTRPLEQTLRIKCTSQARCLIAFRRLKFRQCNALGIFLAPVLCVSRRVRCVSGQTLSDLDKPIQNTFK